MEGAITPSPVFAGGVRLWQERLPTELGWSMLASATPESAAYLRRDGALEGRSPDRGVPAS